MPDRTRRNALYMIFEDGRFIPVGQEEYARWYRKCGVFYLCPNVDLGYSNNVFGGYCGRINPMVDWKPFYLTYSCFNTHNEAYSKTQYFHSFTDLSEQYHFLLTLDWEEFDQSLVAGPYEAAFELWDLF